MDGADDDLAPRTPREWSIALAWYAAGLDHAHRAEEDREERIAAALHAEAVRVVHAAAKLPSHEDLERQRREHTIAAASANQAGEPLDEPHDCAHAVRASLAAARPTPGAAA